MSKKLTPWFPGHVKPVHHGIYETDADTEDGAPCYQSWNGLWWGWCSSWSDFAVDSPSTYQTPNWRGLAKAPK
jgi:hypothetical protein